MYGGYRAPEGVIDVERPRQVERLSRLLSDGAWHVRSSAMGALTWQPDRAAAVRALAHVLTRAASPPSPSWQQSLESRALDLLGMMGPEGKAALRQLLADDAIPTPWIPAALAVVARPPR